MSNFIHKRNKDVVGFKAGDATHIKELIHPNNDPTHIPYSLAWGSIEKGKSSLPHILENEELYYFLDGQAIVHIEEEQIEVNNGDSLLIIKGKKQHVENIGGRKLTFLCIVSPPWEELKEEILRKS